MTYLRHIHEFTVQHAVWQSHFCTYLHLFFKTRHVWPSYSQYCDLQYHGVSSTMLAIYSHRLRVCGCSSESSVLGERAHVSLFWRPVTLVAPPVAMTAKAAPFFVQSRSSSSIRPCASLWVYICMLHCWTFHCTGVSIARFDLPLFLHRDFGPNTPFIFSEHACSLTMPCNAIFLGCWVMLT